MSEVIKCKCQKWVLPYPPKEPIVIASTMKDSQIHLREKCFLVTQEVLAPKVMELYLSLKDHPQVESLSE